MRPTSPLAAPAELRAALRGEPGRLAGARLLDVRWTLAAGADRAGYEAGHLPGAVFVDIDADLAGDTGPGRHPLPTAAAFQAAMRRAGLDAAQPAVAYDAQAGAVAARLWWLLRHFGHESAYVLDGGLTLWPGPLETRAVTPPPGTFAVQDPARDVADADTVAQHLSAGGIVLDVRAPERYRGDTEPVDPVAGHVPGARSAFYENSLHNGRFCDATELRRRFEAAGVRHGADAVVYCGSGINACHTVLALEVAGLPGARLYEGSWSDWCRDPARPVAVGE